MAIDMRDKSTICGAYFNTADSVLSLCDDIPMAAMGVVEQLLAHVEPTTLLVPGRAPEDLLEFIQRRFQGSQTGRCPGPGGLRVE